MPSRSLSRSISPSRSPADRSKSPSRSPSRSRGAAARARDYTRSPSPQRHRSHSSGQSNLDGETHNPDQDQDGDDREENQRKERELAERLKRRAKNGKSNRDESHDERERSLTRSVSPISSHASSKRSRSRSKSPPPQSSRRDDDDDEYYRRSSKSRSSRDKRHSNSSGGREGKRRRRGKGDRRRGEEEGGRGNGYDSDDLFNPKRLKGEGGRSSRRSERRDSVDQDRMTDKEREEYRERRRRELDEQDREFERQRQASSGSGRRGGDDRSPMSHSRGFGGGRRGGDSYRASRERDDGYGSRRLRRDTRSPPPRPISRSRSPVSRRAREDTHSPMGGKTFRTAAEQEDYESRSIFCSQLAVRLGQRDLGEFFEEELGEGSVRDVKIVTDRFTGRSKGLGYVELAAASLVEKAIALSGEKLFGIPILVQRSDAERNRLPTSTEEGGIIHRPNMPQYTLPVLPSLPGNIPLPPSFSGPGGAPIRLGMEGGSASPTVAKPQQNNGSRLYVGSLHFDLTKENVQAVFEPFGAIDSVELHTEPSTGKSKGFAFIQFQKLEDAESALQAMNGFELAGRNIKVGHVSNRGSGGNPNNNGTNVNNNDGGSQPQRISGIDDGLGGKMTNSSRADLMEKLARGETSSVGLPTKPSEETVNQQNRPDSIPVSVSKALLLKNMFDPAEETERDWDLDLADDVKDECQTKYGKVDRIYVEKESAGEIYVKFTEEESAGKALNALNGRWFGGKPITASYISEAFFNAKLG